MMNPESNNPLGFSTMSQQIRYAKNYYSWIFSTIKYYLGNSVLEIGPGWGQIASHILSMGKMYFAVDTSEEVIKYLKKVFPENEERFLKADITDPGISRILATSIDTILTMNLLEHIEDPVIFLKTIRKSFPDARIIIQVPAMECLYGTFDRDAGHFRRYSITSMKETLSKAGYSLIKVSYFNALGALTWLFSTRMLKLQLNEKTTGKFINLNDLLLIPVSKILEPLFRRFIGQSVIAVGE